MMEFTEEWKLQHNPKRISVVCVLTIPYPNCYWQKQSAEHYDYQFSSGCASIYQMTGLGDGSENTKQYLDQLWKASMYCIIVLTAQTESSKWRDLPSPVLPGELVYVISSLSWAPYSLQHAYWRIPAFVLKTTTGTDYRNSVYSRAVLHANGEL